MRRLLPITLLTLAVLILCVVYLPREKKQPLFVPEEQSRTLHPYFDRLVNKFPDLINWQRPVGPPKIALQIGHLENSAVPDELERIKGNTGAEFAGIREVEINEEIAAAVSEQLKAKGYAVEILPTTIPPSYFADLFLAIHADGNTDPNKRGFKASAPIFDYTGKAQRYVQIFEEEYALSTNLPLDPELTRNMTNYYAFSWWRYDHSLHPQTVAAILETGFLSNAEDRKVLVQDQEKVVKGIVQSVDRFMQYELGLIPQNENLTQKETEMNQY